MEHDSLQQIPECHVVILGKTFEDFEDPLFHPDAGLDAFYREFGTANHGTNVPKYQLKTQWHRYVQPSMVHPRRFGIAGRICCTMICQRCGMANGRAGFCLLVVLTLTAALPA